MDAMVVVGTDLSRPLGDYDADQDMINRSLQMCLSLIPTRIATLPMGGHGLRSTTQAMRRAW